MNININITLAHTIINHTTNKKSSRKRRHIDKLFIICTICVIYLTAIIFIITT